MRRTDNIKIKFKKDNRLLTIIITATMFTIAAIVITKIGVSSVYATKGDEHLKLQAERSSYIEKNKALETKIAELQSISRIEKEAKERFGMVKAGFVTYVEVK
jgi:cell division protein FtsB